MSAPSPQCQPIPEKARQKREPKPTFDPGYIRDLSEKVYRARLEQDCAGNVARMIEKDKDEGQKLRNRAGYYDGLTRIYLETLGHKPPAFNVGGYIDDHGDDGR